MADDITKPVKDPWRYGRLGTKRTGGMAKGYRKTAVTASRRDYWAKYFSGQVSERMAKAYKTMRDVLKACPSVDPSLVDQTPDELLMLLPCPIETAAILKAIQTAADKWCDKLVKSIKDIT